MLGKLVGAFIIILLGVTLLPHVNNEVQSFFSSQSANVTSTGIQQTSLTLVPLFFVLAVIITVVVIVFSAFRSGLQSGLEPEEDEDGSVMVYDEAFNVDEEDLDALKQKPKKTITKKPQMKIQTKLKESQIVRSKYD